MSLTSEAIDFLIDAWRRRALELGSLVITTDEKRCEREKNAYHIGRDVGAAYGPSLPESTPRHLRVIS